MTPYLVSLVASFALSAWLCSNKNLLCVLDTPNERSLHERPIPCMGGLAILVGVAIGWMLLKNSGVWPADVGMQRICEAAALIAIVSFIDDIKSLPILFRLGMHGLAAALLAWGMHLGLGMIGTVAVWLSVIWMLNLYNFMDGMDGFSAGMSLSGFGFLGAAAWLHGVEVHAQYAWVIAASSFGFLLLNFPPAKIFMGDVGSTVLGVFAAGFSLWGIRDGLFPLWFPLLVFSPFIVDASVTLARRMLRGEKFWRAHRSHYYQRLAHHLGWGHRRTVFAEYVLMFSVGITAMAILYYPSYVVPGLTVWTVVYILLGLMVDKLCASNGTKENASTFPSWPHYSQGELDAVASVLKSGKVNYWGGDQVDAFEREFAAYVGVPHAIAVCNGTVALELGLRALGIGPGDEVIVPSRTFIATASAVVMCGARPVVADIDEESQNITAETIRPLLTQRTRAVIVVHLAGWPCEMDDICALTQEHGLRLIEDCAQAHGAEYKGKRVGSFGDAAAFSFCQDKIISTGGEGGLLVTSDENVWRKAWAFKDHGKDYATVHEPHSDVGFRWLHHSFGTNFRMTEMQAAIGRKQLEKLEGWLSQRQHNAETLIQGVKKAPCLSVYQPPEYLRHAYYRCYAFIDTEKLRPGWSRDRVITEVCDRGVPCSEGSCSEIYREKAFVEAGLAPGLPLPVASRLGEQSLCFQVHPELNDKHMMKVAEVMNEVLVQAVDGGK